MSHTVHLSFEDIDNTVLQRLCGAFDGNLAALAKALDIDISRRFADFTFTGGNAHAGRRALLALAEAAEHGDLDDGTISLAAVEAKTADAAHEEKATANSITCKPSAAASAGARRAKTATFAPS